MERNSRQPRADGGFLRTRLTRRRDSEYCNARETPGSCPSTIWTDEKHRMYIHSLEASFVQQLNQSLSLRGPCSTLQANDCNLSQQLAYNCERNEDLLDYTSDSRFAEGCSGDTNHLAYMDPHIARGKDGKRMRNELPGSSESSKESDYCLSRQDSVQSVLEVSDQNFIDGESEENSSYASTLKRWKTDGRRYQY